MPEGPSVKRFQLLCTPFVGQKVTKVGGSTKQMNPEELKSLMLCDTQVHGKNLFLAFGAIQEVTSDCRNQSPGRSSDGPAGQGTAASGVGCFPTQQEKNEGAPSDPERHLQEEEQASSPFLKADADEHPWKWLHFHFGLYGSIRANEFARANKANKRGDWNDPIPRLVLHFNDQGLLVFYNCRIRPCSSPTTQPATDILSPAFDQEQALAALCEATPVCYTLLDQRYFSGLGNVIKNEVLYLARIQPLSLGSLLAPSDRQSVLGHAVRFSLEWLNSKLKGERLHLQIYGKDRCPSGHEVQKGTFGPRDGLKRLTWWCPQCQPCRLPEEMPPPHGTRDA
ncbi:endonuclease 8-like 2 [Hemicordylus capensis]|uniref:endonuclease 8-like 2 n=1 Tax=Hemicordylus capensis TaxID=884348 RepID=UPI0023034EA3|nr:endonuclease 8-like 2 [Hemicordylus capensis]